MSDIGFTYRIDDCPDCGLPVEHQRTWRRAAIFAAWDLYDEYVLTFCDCHLKENQ